MNNLDEAEEIFMEKRRIQTIIQQIAYKFWKDWRL